MNANKLFELFSEIYQRGLPGRLTCTVNFEDPNNRINLPLYPKGKDGRDFICYPKGDQWHYVVMSHPQTVNHFETSLLRSFEDKQTRHPEVVIVYKKAGRKRNLIEEPHRIYSAFLSQPHKDYFVLMGKKPWPETEEYKGLYDPDSAVRLRAIAKYSPLTALFGGWGSHSKLSQQPKQTSLVEMEIVGVSLAGKIVSTRRGQGAFMPPDGVPEKVTGGPKGIKWSALGMNTVPLNLDDSSRGAAALKDITLEANLILDRVCSLQLQRPEESLELKMYLTALWLHLFWLGYKRGFSQYQGRELMAKAYSFALKCPPPYAAPKIASALNDIGPDECAKFHNMTLDNVVKLGLVNLTPLHLEASEALDKARILALAPKEDKEVSE